MKNEKKRSKSFMEIRKHLLELLSGSWFFKIPLLVLGFVSLIWFLIMVIPKPDRAAYPCMQAAFPVASAFTAFTKAVSSNYAVSGYINSNKLHLWVSNPADLARMQVWVDNQKINKYIIGGFSDINLDLTGISLTTGEVSVLFEDRYLNTLNITFVAGNTTGIHTVKSDGSLKLYPNPASSVLNVSIEGETPGNYKIDVVSINGTILHSQKYEYLNGSETVQLNLDNLAKAYYVLQVTGPDNKVLTKQFLKN